MKLWNPGGPEPPRIWPLWDAVAARLRSTEMLRLLDNPEGDRVFAPFEDESSITGVQPPWARVVILPVLPSFEESDDVGGDRVVSWLIRADVMPLGGAPYNAMRLLEAIHAEAWRQLREWVPGALEHVEVHLPVWRATAPQSVALWNEADGTYFISAQYRAVAEPLTPVE